MPGSHTTISGFIMMAMFMMMTMMAMMMMRAMTMMIQMGRGLHYSFDHGIGHGAGYGVGQLIIGVDDLKTQSQL